MVNQLKGYVSRLVHVRDICHCLNLVIEDALKNIPAYILQFIKKICSHFTPGQRKSKLKEGEK